MKNKYFPDEMIDTDDLYYICYMIERVARRLKQRNKYVVNAIGADGLYHLLSCAKALHCENPLKTEQEWIDTYALMQGVFDITDVDRELAEHILFSNTPPAFGKIHFIYLKILTFPTNAV